MKQYHAVAPRSYPLVNKKVAAAWLCWVVYSTITTEIENMLAPPTDMEEIQKTIDQIMASAGGNEVSPATGRSIASALTSDCSGHRSSVRVYLLVACRTYTTPLLLARLPTMRIYPLWACRPRCCSQRKTTGTPDRCERSGLPQRRKAEVHRCAQVPARLQLHVMHTCCVSQRVVPYAVRCMRPGDHA